MIRPVACLLVLLLLVACRPAPPLQEEVQPETMEVDSPEAGGAVSMAPVEHDGEEHAPVSGPEPVDVPLDWSELPLTSGQAWIGCELDYLEQGDGNPLAAIDRDSVEAALAPCIERGVMRLRYQGRVTADFNALMQRVTAVADEHDIAKRVLDIDSAGGQVEDAIEAGDFIAESRWTIWVREGAVCHSACVFVLGAGDTRLITGRVGIHRIIRMSSTATTRAELNAELRAVYERVRAYLERNGAATALADLMMAVPNRSLRLLTPDEMRMYGLDGVNPAQDDLDRLRLMRKCGDDFVRRRDAFVRAFDHRCKVPGTDLDTLGSCGLELRASYGFPDEACPAESPLSEFDLAADYVFAPRREPARDTDDPAVPPEPESASGDAS